MLLLVLAGNILADAVVAGRPKGWVVAGVMLLLLLLLLLLLGHQDRIVFLLPLSCLTATALYATARMSWLGWCQCRVQGAVREATLADARETLDFWTKKQKEQTNDDTT